MDRIPGCVGSGRRRAFQEPIFYHLLPSYGFLAGVDRTGRCLDATIQGWIPLLQKTSGHRQAQFAEGSVRSSPQYCSQYSRVVGRPRLTLQRQLTTANSMVKMPLLYE